MLFALGKEGQPVRQFVEAHDQTTALEQGASGEVAVALSGEPRTGARIVNGSLSWPVPTLVQVRDARWIAAKAYRDARSSAGCTTPLGRVQTDERSRLAIRDAADEAAANQVRVPAWSVTWTMADNSDVAHTAAQMVAMATAVRAYVNACHLASRAIRKRIDAAATPVALAAIDITAGYPA